MPAALDVHQYVVERCYLGFSGNYVQYLDGLRMKYTGWVVLGVVLLTVTGWGQSSSYVPTASALASPVTNTDPAEDPILTIRKRVDEVNVLFIATDKRGKFVRNLGQNDFTFLDDHKPPQAIVNFRRETDLPIEMGLLVDTSGSVDSRFTFEQEAASSFWQHIVRANFDKAVVVGFNGHG